MSGIINNRIWRGLEIRFVILGFGSRVESKKWLGWTFRENFKELSVSKNLNYR